MYDLANFQLSDMTRLGADLRAVGDDAETMEGACSRIVGLLHDQLLDHSGQGDGRPCPLVRLYQTLPYQSLQPSQQTFGSHLMEGHTLQPDTRCLTLMATAGEKPRWNSRAQSQGHKTIPLPSTEVVAAIPMVSQLLVQLGLDVENVLKPDPKLVLESEQHSYNVFFVEDAVGSPYIPAQEDFVVPMGIKSVLGFGGLLPSGDVFAVLLFTRTKIPRETANIFRNAAMNVKLCLLGFDESPTFEPNTAS